MSAVLQVNKFFKPVLGGVETVVDHYHGHFQAIGYRSDVLCCNNKFSLRSQVEKSNAGSVYRASSFGVFLSMPVSVSFFILLWRLVAKGGYDYIVFHEPFPLGTIAALFLRAKGAKFVVVWHSDIVRQKLLKRFFEFFQKKLLAKVHRIITTSDLLASSSTLLKQNINKVSVVPLSGEDYSKRGHGVCPIELQDSQLRPFYFSFGRMVYYKGIQVLLDAYESICSNHDVNLILAGVGPLSESVIAASEREPLKGRILFIHRHLSEEEKIWLLRNAIAFVFPSTHRSEAFGLTQLEAMSLGVPVINTKLDTGVPWVSLHGLSGLTAIPGSVPSLAEAMATLAENDALRDKLKQGAKERYFGFFTKEICEKKLSEALGM